MAKNKILATFRVDEDDWEAFKQWAEKRGNSASGELIRFIESALGRATLDDMDTVDKKIESAIASLRTELAPLYAIAQREDQIDHLMY